MSFKYLRFLCREKGKQQLELADLIHYMWKFGADVLSSVIIKYLLERDVLKCNKSRLQHVDTSLVCKCENRHCLQKQRHETQDVGNQ